MVNAPLIWRHASSPDGAKRNSGPGSRVAFRFTRATPASVLGRENPVPAGLQADDFAGLQFPVAGGVDLDHGLALAARERDLRPLDRAERADMTHRALQRAGSRRADLHVMAAHEQF